MELDKNTEVEQEGLEFKRVLGEVISSLPSSMQKAPGLSKSTGLSASSCRRVLTAINPANSGADTLLSLPGTEALETLVGSLASHGTSQALLENVKQAIDRYQARIYEHGNSQASLKKFLTGVSANPEPARFASISEKVASRTKAFDVNKALSGESIDHYVGLHILHRHHQQPDYLSELMLAHRIGINLSESARPFTQPFSGHDGPITLEEPEFIEDIQKAKLSSKNPSNFVLTAQSTNNIEHYYQGINRNQNAYIFSANQQSFDVCCGRYSPLSQQWQPSLSTVCGISCRTPGKRLTMIVMLDKTLAQSSIVKAGCYPSSLKIYEKPHRANDIRYERIANSPNPKLFDPQLNDPKQVISDFNIQPVLSIGSTLTGMPLDNFLCYLIDIPFPIWQTTYRLYIEFHG